jgi:hypothetical protein
MIWGKSIGPSKDNGDEGPGGISPQALTYVLPGESSHAGLLSDRLADLAVDPDAAPVLAAHGAVIGGL